MLFELCPTSQRCVSHKGPQKDVNNIKSCLKVLNECGENTPSLLGRMEQLYAELCSIKHAVQVQADVSEDFRTITVDINRRGCALERSSDLTRGHGLGASAEMVGDTGEGAMAGTTGLDGMDNTALEAASVAAGAPGLDAEELARAGPSALDVESAVTAKSPGGLTSLLSSPKWSHVVKRATVWRRFWGMRLHRQGHVLLSPD